MKFAIRDDDICFFTKPEELIRAYDFLDKGTISLSVINNAYPYHGNEKPFGKSIPEGFYSLKNNKELIKFLKKQIKDNKVDILLHGCTHEYKRDNNKWIPEMGWKKGNQLFSELQKAKAEMEELFGQPVNTFTAPSGEIHKEGILFLEQLNMNYSGSIGKRISRKIDLSYIANYIKNLWSLAIHHMPYGGVSNYSGHKELAAYPITTFEEMTKRYEHCKKHDYPFVIYTHYWNLNKNKGQKDILKRIYEYISNDGFNPVPLSKCFEK